MHHVSLKSASTHHAASSVLGCRPRDSLDQPWEEEDASATDDWALNISVFTPSSWDFRNPTGKLNKMLIAVGNKQQVQ